MPKATIYDVAKRAGVSVATVSKVVNRTGRISQATRMRVEHAAHDLQYQPSLVASALKNNRTFSIGMLIPDITSPFYGELVREIEDQALNYNYSVLVSSTDNLPERECKHIELLVRKQLDGIIIATAEGSGTGVLDILQRHDMRVVCIDRSIPGSPYPLVATDHFRGAYLATEHLIALGHRRIAIFLEPLDISSASERLRGFRAALAGAGLSCGDDRLYYGGFGAEAGYDLATRMLKQSQDLPTALFVNPDLMAIGVLQRLHEAGIAIPGDISVVGYDGIRLTTMVSPPLTTVAQPIAQISKLALDFLLSESPPRADTTLVEPRLIVRGSSAPPRVDIGRPT